YDTLMFLRGLFFILLTASFALAQSGRVKPVETPKPGTSKVTPPIVYNPTNNDRPRVATPTPTPASTAPDDGEITVESNLVPIPVSVLDASGRAVTNLKLTDFMLEVDGKPVGIGELT